MITYTLVTEQEVLSSSLSPLGLILSLILESLYLLGSTRIQSDTTFIFGQVVTSDSLVHLDEPTLMLLSLSGDIGVGNFGEALLVSEFLFFSSKKNQMTSTNAHIPNSTHTILIVHVLPLLVEASLMVANVPLYLFLELFIALLAFFVTPLVFSPVFLKISGHALAITLFLFDVCVESLRDGVQSSFLVSLALSLKSGAFRHAVRCRGGVVTASSQRNVSPRNRASGNVGGSSGCGRSCRSSRVRGIVVVAPAIGARGVVLNPSSGSGISGEPIIGAGGVSGPCVCVCASVAVGVASPGVAGSRGISVTVSSRITRDAGISVTSSGTGGVSRRCVRIAIAITIACEPSVSFSGSSCSCTSGSRRDTSVPSPGTNVSGTRGVSRSCVSGTAVSGCASACVGSSRGCGPTCPRSHSPEPNVCL